MMRFRLLGPVEVRAGEEWRGIGAPKWRSVLAALLIYPGQIVSADTLIGELWRDEPPARAANLVSIYVLRLRRLMDDPDGRLLVTRSPGYLLRVAGDDTDALLFEAMVRDGRRAFAARDPEGAASRLTEALGLWYGRPLADVPPTPLVEAEAERLGELRLGADELRITAELALGGHDQAVAEVRRLLADHPLREGLWLLLMRALDGAGRHAEALEAYGQARDAISGQLGVDPGAELRQLHADLLAKDTAPAGVITVSIPGGTPPRSRGGCPPPRTPLGRPAAGVQEPPWAPPRRSCRPISPTSPGAFAGAWLAGFFLFFSPLRRVRDTGDLATAEGVTADGRWQEGGDPCPEARGRARRHARHPGWRRARLGHPIVRRDLPAGKPGRRR
jgi:DNA-binding SARP family transcriptional activator